MAQSVGAVARGPVKLGGSRPGLGVGRGVGRVNGVREGCRAVGPGVQATKVRRETRTAVRREACGI